MRRKVFVYNQVSKPTSILSTQTKVITVDNKTIVINGIDRIPNLSYGMMLTISGTPYTYVIQRVVYNENIRQYVISFDGNYNVINSESRTIVFYNVNETAIRESYEIDIEQYQLEVVLQVSDLTDINARLDNLSKTIVFPDTERNREAFGNPEMFNKQTNINEDERLNQNYNPINPVKFKVFDDGFKVFEGDLYMYEVNYESGKWEYVGVVAGYVNDFKTRIGDKMLTDIDLIDLQHSYRLNNLFNSWGGYNPGGNYSFGSLSQIVTNNWTNSSTVLLKPVEIGKNYVYPYIEYGEQTEFWEKGYDNLNSSGGVISTAKDRPNPNQDWKNLKLQNFRPCLYVTEIMDRMFKEIKMKYEIKHYDQEFVDNFKRLIIPNNELKLTSAKFGVVGRFFKPYVQATDSFGGFGSTTIEYRQSSDTRTMIYPCHFGNSDVQEFVKGAYIYGNGDRPLDKKKNARLVMSRNMTTDIKVDLTWSAQDVAITNAPWQQEANANKPKTYLLQVVKRTAKQADDAVKATKNYTSTSGADNEMTEWEPIYERTYDNILNATTNHTTDILIRNVELKMGDEIMVIFKFNLLYDLNNFESLPRVVLSEEVITFGSSDVQTVFEPKLGDNIRPMLPANVSQMEFLKGLVTTFNFVVYVDKLEDKVIFEPYDSYYQRCQPSNLKAFALDWSQKVDYSQPLKIKTNTEIAKKYKFTFAEDSDFYSKEYKNKYNEAYSTFDFIDSKGIVEEKKVESIFAASPTITIDGTDRYFVMISTGGTNYSREPMASKMRLLYFNGVFACSGYDIIDDEVFTRSLMSQPTEVVDWVYKQRDIKWYGFASNYLASPLTEIHQFPYGLTLPLKPAKFLPMGDLHFYRPKEFFFDPYVNWFLNLDGSYKHYRSQISQLTNPNMRTAEVYVHLTQDEVANFDLRIPVFINFKDAGQAYFKVINLTWNADNPLAIATLQQINQV